MTPAAPAREWPWALGLAGLGAVTVLALAWNPLAAVAPVVLAAAAWAVARLPLRYPVAALALAMLVLDNPQDRPAAGRWQPPLQPLGSLLFENLNKLTGIDALRIAPIDLLLVGLLALALYRGAAQARTGAAGAGTAAPLTRALVLALGGLLLAEAWGLARGGDVKASLWQTRQLFAIPVLALLFLSAFEDLAGLRVLARLAVVAAVVRTLQGLYFYEVVCRPLNYRPPYVTSHSDTLLFTGVLVMAAAYWHERPTRLSRRLLFLVGPLMALAIYINGRRLAYVALAAAVAVVFALSAWTPLKKAVARLSLLAAPFAALYLAVGWNLSGGVFRPAQMVKSLVSSEADRSTHTRDIENYNLVMTLKTNPLLGTGFGHEYRELSKADDISQLFPQYRLIPHNSLLGLLAFSGVLGFWLAWLPLVVGAFLAARSYPRARTPEDRTTALVCLSLFMTYALQAYGDMGLQSWEGALLLAAALAATGRLAVQVGAWGQGERTPLAAS